MKVIVNMVHSNHKYNEDQFVESTIQKQQRPPEVPSKAVRGLFVTLCNIAKGIITS